MDRRRVFAVVEFDGTDFEGFQVQKSRRTVQGELEEALGRVTGEATRVVGAGRTDTGVHAAGLGVHLDTIWNRPLAVLERAWNARLPRDIAVRDLVPVPSDFSARYDATTRLYRYTILNQVVRAPLIERYAFRVPEPLDASAMDAAARELIGQHDFGAFGTPPRGDNTIRTMYQAGVRRVGVQILIDLEANAFLYRMVRRIVGSLISVGRGVCSAGDFRQVLARKRRAGDAAPAHGLCLIQVKYERLADDLVLRSKR